MSARAAGWMLAALALLGAGGVAVVGQVQGTYDGLLVVLACIAVVAAAVLVVRDARRGRPTTREGLSSRRAP